eukprot:TRINITY_DN33906_c0_g1_i1.p1 TRINITY_DN33906_c0_g1~~TRINITY_DN33906_c0_g1_i1.p1  ORF type:complete len:415 (+),score=65.55 TRINITY_DN33906_c0_g1_i1:127-1371(+)
MLLPTSIDKAFPFLKYPFPEDNWEVVCERFGYISYALVLAVIWYWCRKFFKSFVGPACARLCGIRRTRPVRAAKFSYQLWLLTYYSFAWGMGHYLYLGRDLNIVGCPYLPWKCAMAHTSDHHFLPPAAVQPKLPPMLEPIDSCLGPMRQFVTTGLSVLHDAVYGSPVPSIVDTPIPPIALQANASALPPVVGLGRQWMSGIPISSLFIVFYLCEAGFYMSELVAILIEPRRSDFVVYVVHHVGTLILIFGSWSFGEEVLGLVVLWLHDFPDTLLSAAKLCLYVKQTFLAQVIFALFAVAYFVFRVVGMTMMFVANHAVGREARGGFAMYPFALEVLLFGILTPLHVYWFSLIVRMLFANASEDPRSDDESDDDRQRERKDAMLGIHKVTRNVLGPMHEKPEKPRTHRRKQRNSP